MKIPNISLGFSKSKYTHNLSRDCNTTFPFGVVQPIFTQYMLPNSDIRVDAKQLIRLAPMPVPSFARVSLRTVTRFVPEIDVVPYADAFYSKIPYRGKVPASLPTISNVDLVNYLLSISNFTIYSLTKNGSGFTYTEVPSLGNNLSSFQRAIGNLFINAAGSSDPYDFTLLPSHMVTSQNSTPYRPAAFPESCDYLLMFSTNASTSTVSSPTHCICFNFGFKAKNFRNVCVGLGYSLDIDDYTPLRFSPLLSYYKAYYDTYGIKRFKAFTETPCFDIISNWIDTLSKISFVMAFRNKTDWEKLSSFFSDIADSYYSIDSDFVSLHRQNLVTTAPIGNFDPMDGKDNTVYVPGNAVPSIDLQNEQYVTDLGLRALSRLSKFVSKNSILGKRLSDYMRLKYGTTVIASIFKDSNFVNSSVLNCNINDVFSTSDTAQYDSATDTRTGENLGAYAGKGLGFGDLSFKYSAPCHGYLITLAAIVPDAGYCQGNSLDLFAVKWEQQPNSDFDALGYEATPRSAFITHNSICNRASLGTDDITNKSFGFMPRFSGFKYSKNVVNGDMSRRGTVDSLSPYYLDHLISSLQVEDTSTADKKSFLILSAAVPSSSYNWRYVCKYPFLGNFNRLFINDVGPLYKGSSAGTVTTDATYSLFCLDDSFICQSSFRVSLSNCLKPLSLSFDTYDDETDNASTKVDPS
ncbi:hypothetical protein [Prevotella sp.]|uniref:hypothetical protein n=1 Tax=Prevotella sp. TaxID=59823 RepID=UPI0027E34B8B|nr:hypothetical protein [Prevotella sp.]